MMKKAYEEGKKVRFTKGRLLIDGKAVPVPVEQNKTITYFQNKMFWSFISEHDKDWRFNHRATISFVSGKLVHCCTSTTFVQNEDSSLFNFIFFALVFKLILYTLYYLFTSNTFFNFTDLYISGYSVISRSASSLIFFFHFYFHK